MISLSVFDCIMINYGIWIFCSSIGIGIFLLRELRSRLLNILIEGLNSRLARSSRSAALEPLYITGLCKINRGLFIFCVHHALQNLQTRFLTAFWSTYPLKFFYQLFIFSVKSPEKNFSTKLGYSWILSCFIHICLNFLRILLCSI